MLTDGSTGVSSVQSFFGFPLSQPLVYVAAFAVICILLAVFAWVLRKVTGRTRVEGNGRGRQPRLGIVDTFPIDRQRQLVIIRRDSVEHLLLVGGTSDILIESNIIRSLNVASVREPAPQAKPSAPINGTTNGSSSVRSSNVAELSFAPEQKEAVVPPPLPPQPAFPVEPVFKPVAIPRATDLAEIANRFQSSSASPLIAEREPAIAQSDEPIPLPQVVSVQRNEELISEGPSLSTVEPIIPSVERDVPSISVTPEARDAGSLNDTLRQLLGRTRDH